MMGPWCRYCNAHMTLTDLVWRCPRGCTDRGRADMFRDLEALERQRSKFPDRWPAKPGSQTTQEYWRRWTPQALADWRMDCKTFALWEHELGQNDYYQYFLEEVTFPREGE